jgi:malate dehydrogenase (oxaloacetate-decarboxylating)
VYDIVVDASDPKHQKSIAARVADLEGVRVLRATDRTFRIHRGGKLEVHPRSPMGSPADLSMVYTPGVARVCLAIRDDPARRWDLTTKGHTIAVVPDGTRVLGLGDIGPAAAQPVMEGKCAIFKAFGNVDAVPICLATTDDDEIVATVQRIAPVFGGINLEDIATPRCFEIEERLRRTLDIPVMHDDQHGTAIVVLAGVRNALRLVRKTLAEAKIVISGAGAAGLATARMLRAAVALRIVSCDRAGALYRGRTANMNRYKEALAADTNPDGERGGLRDVLRGADVFIGLSAPGLLTRADVATMASDAIVFALANPVPEVQPEEIEGLARVIATGRSDYPNQVNNSLAFPGVFRGALRVRASDINEAMKLAAAQAIAGLVGDADLREENIIPSMFDRRVAPAVARAVRRAARALRAARR